MKHAFVIIALIAAISLTGCQKKNTMEIKLPEGKGISVTTK